MTTDSDLDRGIPGNEWAEGSEATVDRLLRDAPNPQAAKFRAAAREVGADDSEEAFDAVLKRVAGGKHGKKAAAPKGDRHDD